MPIKINSRFRFRFAGCLKTNSLEHSFVLMLFLFFCVNISKGQIPYTVWVQSSSTSFLSGRNLMQDNSGNLYTAGYYRGTVNLGAGASTAYFTAVDSTDGFIRKVDSDGNFKWAKSIGNRRSDGIQHIAAGDSGNVFAVGYFTDTLDFDPSPLVDVHIANGQYSLMIVKFDSSGNYRWGKHIDANINSKGVCITGDGKLIVVGHYKDSADFDPDGGKYLLKDNNIFILSLSCGDGSFISAYSLGSADLSLSACTADSGNNLWLSGSIDGSADMDMGTGTYMLTGKGAFTAKYTNTGELINAGVIIPDLTSGMNIFDICTDADRNLIATGNFYGTVDFDAGIGIAKLNTSGFYPNAFVLKLDSTGKFIWVRQINGNLYSGALSVIADSKSDLFVNGQFEGVADFTEGTTAHKISSAGSLDLFLLKLSKGGSFEWLKSMGGTENEFAGKVVTDDKGGVIQSGHFLKEIFFDYDGYFSLKTSAINGDYFLHKIKEVPLSISEMSDGLIDGFIYPNPAREVLNIQGLESGSMIELYDVMGKLMKNEKVMMKNSRLDIKSLPAGIYTLKVTTKEGNVGTAKVVKD